MIESNAGKKLSLIKIQQEHGPLFEIAPEYTKPKDPRQ